jgi:transposase
MRPMPKRSARPCGGLPCFVPVKTPQQQAALVAHSVRDLLVRQRTMLVNALRGHLAEFGIVAQQGIHRVQELTAVIADETDRRLPASARGALRLLAAELAAIDRRIMLIEAEIVARMRTDLVARRLATIPGIGPMIATRITAVVPDPSVFRSGRDFAAWIGLVPAAELVRRQEPSLRHSKRGNSSLRRLLVGGAMAAMFRSKALQQDPWLCQLRARKPAMVAAVALANKIAPGGRRRDLLDRTSLPPCSPASRPCRLRRWPSASLDPGCARRRRCVSRDGETVLRSNRETYVCEGKTRGWMSRTAGRPGGTSRT